MRALTANEWILGNGRVASMATDHLAITPADIHILNGVIHSCHPCRPAHAYPQPYLDAEAALITPGLIDCHTHLVFGGNRATEWGQRLEGRTYADIAAQGGGINHTVQATRAAAQTDLYLAAKPRLEALLTEGVTTIELKSGYGLTLADERKQLQVAQTLAQLHPIEIVSTLLAAHTVPPEYQHQPDDYVALICETIMPTLWQEGLFEAVDVFCETIGFSLAQTERIFQTAAKLNIPVKGHTEQLTHSGGSALVAQYQGLSADHIEHLTENDIALMKQQGTVATVLPLAFYFLQETQHPPITLLRQHQIPIAVSTDFNPGTAPMASIRLAMNMACVLLGLTPTEAWFGVTKHAAKALGRAHTHGQIAPGFVADLLVWQADHPVDLIYELGRNPLQHRIFRGQFTEL
ncbi:MAG: imidazolonepropionase [Neisseriaceae bacterium]|nr:imidazolonepropionase [Neisseriaceae bacterium]